LPSPDFEIKNAEFYIDGEMKYNDTDEPYQWLWNEHAVGSHEIMVKGYDEGGREAVDKINVVIFNL